MIRALFNLVTGDSAHRVASRSRTESDTLSRRDFLTFGRGRHRADGMWQVVIDAPCCTDCRACVRTCPAQALHRANGDACVTYSLSLALCNGCADCMAVCATNAVTVFRAAERQADENVADIAVLQKMMCKQCSRLEAGVVDGVCAMCQAVGGPRGLESGTPHD